MDTSGGVLAAPNGIGGPIEGVDGNWRCTACQNINFPKRITCHKCSSDKPPYEVLERRNQEIAERRAAQAAMRAQPPKDSWKAPANKANWLCATCDFVNPYNKASCGQCDAPKEGNTAHSDAQQFFNPETEQLYDPATGMYYKQTADGSLQPLPLPLPHAQTPAPMPIPMVAPSPVPLIASIPSVVPSSTSIPAPGGKTIGIIDPKTGQIFAQPVSSPGPGVTMTSFAPVVHSQTPLSFPHGSFATAATVSGGTGAPDSIVAQLMQQVSDILQRHVQLELIVAQLQLQLQAAQALVTQHATQIAHFSGSSVLPNGASITAAGLVPSEVASNTFASATGLATGWVGLGVAAAQSNAELKDTEPSAVAHVHAELQADTHV